MSRSVVLKAFILPTSVRIVLESIELRTRSGWGEPVKLIRLFVRTAKFRRSLSGGVVIKGHQPRCISARFIRLPETILQVLDIRLHATGESAYSFLADALSTSLASSLSGVVAARVRPFPQRGVFDRGGGRCATSVMSLLGRKVRRLKNLNEATKGHVYLL